MFDRIALKVAIAKQCISIRELANRSNVGYDTLSKILNTDREPNAVTIGKIAAALDVSPKDLLKKC